MGLQQQFGMIRGIAHGDRNLDLPLLGSGLDDHVHQRGQVGHDASADLRVDADIQARLARPPQRVESLLKRPRHTAQFIMQRLQPVKRNA